MPMHPLTRMLLACLFVGAACDAKYDLLMAAEGVAA